MLWYIYYNQRLCVIPFVAWNVSIIRLLLPTSYNFWFMFANQLWADQCGICLIAKLFYSVHKKLRTCGEDFKYCEVADLRLRIQKSWNIVADLRLRTKVLNVQLRTCGCGLRKLKFGCGVADWGLKKKLAMPSTAYYVKCAFTLDAKHPQFGVTDNLRKVSTYRKLRVQCKHSSADRPIS